MKKKTNLYKLAEKLATSSMVFGYLFNKKMKKEKPGDYIKSLPKEEREQIKKLKPRHFNNRLH